MADQRSCGSGEMGYLRTYGSGAPDNPSEQEQQQQQQGFATEDTVQDHDHQVFRGGSSGGWSHPDTLSCRNPTTHDNCAPWSPFSSVGKGNNTRQTEITSHATQSNNSTATGTITPTNTPGSVPFQKIAFVNPFLGSSPPCPSTEIEPWIPPSPHDLFQPFYPATSVRDRHLTIDPHNPSVIPREAREPPHDPEWAGGVFARRNQFRSSNAGSPHFFSANASFLVNGSARDCPSFIEDSDLDRQQQRSPQQRYFNRQQHQPQQQRYFDTSMDESSPLGGAYGLPNPHEVQPTGLHQQSYGSYDESRIQPPIPAIANIVEGNTPRNGARSTKPLVTPYYITPSHSEMLGSPVSGTNCLPYTSQTGPVPHDGFPQSQDLTKSSNSTQEQVLEPHMAGSSFQPGLPVLSAYNSPQFTREDDRQLWANPRPQGIRWAKSEQASPIEDTDIQSPTLRRSSLKTCELGDTGLGFPGCYVLVPTTDSPPDSASQSGDGPEPSLVSAKKSIRRPMEESERAAIKLNRKLGVCLRCKIFKERCRGGSPCERCRSLRHWKSICVSAHFAHKSIFSRGLWKARLVPSLQNVDEWVPLTSHPTEYILVSNGYAPSLMLTVQRFSPIDPALLDHVLWRELRKTDFARIPSTAVAISVEVPLEELDRYFDDHIIPLVAEISVPPGGLIHEQTYMQTLRAACDYHPVSQENGFLVRKALRLWAAQIVFFKAAWRISGPNKVGMSPIQDPNSKVCGITPLPRLANQQLDARVEEWMAQTEQQLLAELQTKIFRRNSTDWFTIYLTLFITLSTLELDTWGLKTWAMDAGDLLGKVDTMGLMNPSETRKAWTWPLADNPGTLVERNAFLTETLVAHFRSVTKGFVPFTLDWHSDQAVVMAGGERYALEYMRTIGQRVKASNQQLRGRIGAEYSREDINSLKSSYSAKLMVGEES